MNKAQAINNLYGKEFFTTNALLLADSLAIDSEQNWDEGSTIFKFDDGSKLFINAVNIKVIN